MQNRSASRMAKPRVPFNKVVTPIDKGITVGAFFISSAVQRSESQNGKGHTLLTLTYQYDLSRLSLQCGVSDMSYGWRSLGLPGKADAQVMIPTKNESPSVLQPPRFWNLVNTSEADW